MDGRQRVLRPRTRVTGEELDQPMSWQGLDTIAQRAVDPVRTFETPLVYFPAEILIPVGQVLTIPLPPRCAQIAFISLVPNVTASINGGGPRTVKDGFIYNGEFQSLQVATDATGTVLIQLGCY